MSEQNDLHLLPSRELHTDEPSLEHDTMVVSAELTQQVTDALGRVALTAASGHTPLADLSRARP